MENRIFVTSDLHLCHDKDFLYTRRGFTNITEHDETIVKNWNETVSPLDTVYVLGDLMLKDDKRGMSLLKQLNGTITIIAGNHDTETRILNYFDSYNVTDIHYGLPLKHKGYLFFLSHYPTLCGNFDEDKPLKKKVINLCGHTHTLDKWHDWDKGLIYHCELDAHNNKPVLLDDIIADIEAKIS